MDVEQIKENVPIVMIILVIAVLSWKFLTFSTCVYWELFSVWYVTTNFPPVQHGIGGCGQWLNSLTSHCMTHASVRNIRNLTSDSTLCCSCSVTDRILFRVILVKKIESKCEVMNNFQSSCLTKMVSQMTEHRSRREGWRIILYNWSVNVKRTQQLRWQLFVIYADNK
jgi:hypothetical protein